MSRKYKFHNNDRPYFVSFAVINWIDLFIRNEYKEVLLKSMRYCMDNKGMELFGYCIMTSHVHMVIGSKGPLMQNIMRDLKRHTSETLHQQIKKHPRESRRTWMLDMMKKAGLENNNNYGFQLWQQHNHPIELYNSKICWQKLDYIHANPVVAGFVEKEEDWLYSSARNYHGMPGLIEVSLLDMRVISF